MDIDVSALKSLVREKNLSLELVVESIEQRFWSPISDLRVHICSPELSSIERQVT